MTDVWLVKEVGKVPNAYVEAWAVYEAFRRLGYADDDVLTEFAPGVHMGSVVDRMIHVSLLHGGLKFTVDVAQVEESFERAREIHYLLRKAIRKRKHLSDRVLLEMWDRSSMGKEENFTMLVAAMMAKGFDPPALMKGEKGASS